MTADELAIKLTGKVEFMIQQYLPRPACQTKHKAHSELVQQVKEKIAARLGGNGITINISP
jgi:hypothetical protein